MFLPGPCLGAYAEVRGTVVYAEYTTHAPLGYDKGWLVTVADEDGALSVYMPPGTASPANGADVALRGRLCMNVGLDDPNRPPSLLCWLDTSQGRLTSESVIGAVLMGMAGMVLTLNAVWGARRVRQIVRQRRQQSSGAD